jgi:quercetin dioxygenase-like cupin family protein
MIRKDGFILTSHEGHIAFIAKQKGSHFSFGAREVSGTWYGIADNIIAIQGDGDELIPVAANTVFSMPSRKFQPFVADVFDDQEANLWLFYIGGFVGQQVGGVKVEKKGRLKYIDGCTDSVLIPNPKLGDPVLNHLHFPAGIDQTFHTHPSIRLGIVLRGNGVASFPDGEHALATGDIFCLEVGERHRFRTPDEGMDIIAFHPDSDMGPTDEDHPMINRTII